MLLYTTALLPNRGANIMRVPPVPHINLSGLKSNIVLIVFFFKK